MATARRDLPAFVGNPLGEQDGDVQREGVRVLVQALTEAEVVVPKVRAMESRCDLSHGTTIGTDRRTPTERSLDFEPLAQAINNRVARADSDAGGRTDGLATAARAALDRRLARGLRAGAGGVVRGCAG